MAFGTAGIWGVTFISTKVLLGYGLFPAEIFFYRFLLAYLCFCFFAPRRLFAKTVKDEFLMLAAGVTGGSLYFLSENTALQLTLTSNVALILTTAPILTALVARLFNKNLRLKASLIGGSIVALLGVAFVVFNGRFILNLNPKGDLLTFSAALLWAFYSLIILRLNARYNMTFITRKIFFYGVLTILPVFLFRPIHTEMETILQPVVLGNLLFLSLVASMACYFFWNMALKELGAIQATNYLYLVPLVTLFASAYFLDEPVTLFALLGSLFILSGVYFADHGLRLKGLSFFHSRNQGKEKNQ
ncbi:DMT family transporter [Parabacteroides sp. Marseille-P3160]|uniref:DMT family transporter n=1 Tax=Parabacteroides sp. Marseille-P3160 TaxID=1917887 RepID=UPI00190EBFDD|nr:DMT family transporter [Parabacteroides sp. Marseille-P3160]